MGGGSGLLINSNRRKGSSSGFGCEGWFCDLMDGAMVMLVVMVIATALIGCLKACLCKKQKQLLREPKPTSEAAQEVPNGPELPQISEAPPPMLPVVIVLENPPEYAENDQYMPPAYCTLRFNNDEEAQI
ncbi:uncharacterized protein CELE_C49G9.1 [Caenorhabditis elegans]|uniref:Uncharacterized protein n=1 Tax=Caenorhabditis elegans TaxID=6239 RepID=Q9XXK9_CAEEL|nr:Uncharacterized protein CELE_C49G9.1 [Caenorhabditis elegans]CAA18634.1 Uncharacterized protein CELE_C49G9.1 [Caenorhabditis elegans]|eukprot:NP_493186.1 Uncharacterized protein CELE_C49G9.1 [Caenorhabditis elegans]